MITSNRLVRRTPKRVAPLTASALAVPTDAAFDGRCNVGYIKVDSAQPLFPAPLRLRSSAGTNTITTTATAAAINQLDGVSGASVVVVLGVVVVEVVVVVVVGVVLVVVVVVPTFIFSTRSVT
jgi:hypothetical protein